MFYERFYKFFFVPFPLLCTTFENKKIMKKYFIPLLSIALFTGSLAATPTNDETPIIIVVKDGNDLGGGKQFWNHLDTTYENRYTPVFIDLIDNYNQYYELGAQYNNDPISAVPLNVVINMAMQNDNWSSLKAALSGKIGQYYTLGDYNTFVSPYDYYFSML